MQDSDGFLRPSWVQTHRRWAVSNVGLVFKGLSLSGLASSGPALGLVFFWAMLATPLAGCRAKKSEPAAVPELSFAVQLSAVQTGKADEIRLEQAAIGAGELAQLSSAPQLRVLVLDAGVVHDEEVKHLTSLSGLQHLRLRESPLTDAGLKELAAGQLQSLLILNLPQARPTEIGLKELARLPKLRQLRIAGRQINDAAIEELSHWPALTSLHLIQPGITERSLETIAAMQELSSLYIDECPLPDAAWTRLFTARPNLHVHIDQAHHDLDPHAH